jgi:hypothetical protein
VAFHFQGRRYKCAGNFKDATHDPKKEIEAAEDLQEKLLHAGRG